jgi:hypothetical protein
MEIGGVTRAAIRLEEEFGPWETVYGVYNSWSASGLLDEILLRLQTRRIDAKKIDLNLWCVDGTVVRAHRCAGGVAKKKRLVGGN